MTGASPRLRVLLTRRLIARDLDYLRARLDPGIDIVIPPAYSDEALLDAARDAEVLLGPYINRALLEAHGGHLRLIQVPWTGVDNLDFGLLREFRPVVANSHTNAFAVAEHTVALLLAVLRAIPLHDRDLRRGRWRRPDSGPVTAAPGAATSSGFLPPVSLQGHEVLLAGYGAIAVETARLLVPFGVTLRGMRTTAITPPPAPLAELAGTESRLELAGRADVVILTLPLTPATRHFVDRAFLAAMKPTAFLVNVGRGQLIADDALYEALTEGRIAGAALDTWWNYPSASDPAPFPNARFPFHELENVVLSPHRAGFTRDSLPHLDGAADNLNRLAAGLPPENVVDLDRGY